MKKNSKYKKCLDYIEKYWDEATFSLPRDTRRRLRLPNKFVAPNDSKFNGDQFYWDSYFIILGLVDSGRVKLAKGMVDNLISLYNRLGYIPARNMFNGLAVSQPPFLTSMILEIFERDQDKKWLAKAAKAAEGEWLGYWKDGDLKTDIWPNHFLPSGLSRYTGTYYRTSFLAEYESGWDETSRFGNHCLAFAAVDLNSLLYKYEIDLAKIYGILGKKGKEGNFKLAAQERQSAIDKFLWNNWKGFYFDYNKRKKKQSKFWSLAGFYPLWAGLASKKQAARAVKNLKKFECEHGLANSRKSKLLKPYRQWDYPNGWPNQQWIVVKGLLNYGYEKEAQRIARKWLDLNADVFKKTKKMWEKYNVVKGDVGRSDYRYETQSGFGWTNGVFLRLVKEVLK